MRSASTLVELPNLIVSWPQGKVARILGTVHTGLTGCLRGILRSELAYLNDLAGQMMYLHLMIALIERLEHV